MINPHIKNKRTGFHQDILNRSYHYMKLIHSKPQVDSIWNKSNVKSQFRSSFQQSLEACKAEDNMRLMNKIIQIERRSTQYDAQTESHSANKKSLKSNYRQYQKELAISQQNVKMMKKISNIKSDLSKKKMDQFGHQMAKYSRLKLSSPRNIEVIDDLFYKNYRYERLKERAKTIVDNKTQYKFNRKKFKSRSHRKTEQSAFSQSQKKIQADLLLK